MPGFNFSLYAFTSCLVTTSVIFNAYLTKQQFYATVVHLVKSKFSLLTLFNFAFVMFFIFAKLTRRIFLGQLRASELEVLWENTGYAITETCLALTIFRQEMDLNTYLLFSCLLFVKAFHWLCQARVQHMEQDEERYKNFFAQFRIVSFILVLLASDLMISIASLSVVMETGPSVQILFGFEFLLLFIAAISILIKYILVVIDTFVIRERWYNKSLYEMYSKLVLSFVHFTVYAIFFFIIFSFYGIPIHLMRSLYISFHNAVHKLKHFIQFRKVSADLDSKFADATEEELDATDRVCVICREDMALNPESNSPETRIKKLPCGHIFHFHCLRTWFERQLKCPTCRANVVSLSNNSQRNQNANRNVNQNPPNQQENRDRVEEQPAAPVQNNEVPNDEAETEQAEDQGDNNQQQRAPARRRVRLRRLNANIVENLRRIQRNRNAGAANQERNEPENLSESSNRDEQGNTPELETYNSARNYLSVNEHLQNQIDLLSIQLRIYTAQMSAARASFEAAQVLLQAPKEEEANSSENGEPQE